jgi:hypothetical protein
MPMAVLNSNLALSILLVCVASTCLAQPSLTDAPFRHGTGWKALLSGHDVSGWHGRAGRSNDWFTTTAVRWDQSAANRLDATSAPGPIIINGPGGRTADLISDSKFGDVEIYLEFLISKGSNSGVYVHGLYEVQILDSYGVEHPGVHDCGAIYERWIDNKGVGGSPPSRNASRPAGEWQSFHIWFLAPRFDAGGKKIENGRFLKVVHNGVQVQENIAVEGTTRAGMEFPEAASNPLMLQGDHGPVAFRNIYVRPLRR